MPDHHAHHDDHARFNDLAANWDEQPGSRERATMIAEAVRSAVELTPTTRVLEIGAGTGLLSRALADEIAAAVVTDVATGMVAATQAALDDPRYQGWRAELFDVEHDQLPSEQFDLVLSQLALHHMGDIAAIARRILTMLVRGGQVALVDLEHDADGGFHRHIADFHGHPGFSREALAGFMREAGFVDVTVSDAGHETTDVDGVERQFPLIMVTGRRPRG